MESKAIFHFVIVLSQWKHFNCYGKYLLASFVELLTETTVFYFG